MDAVRKLIKKIRNQHPPPKRVETPVEKFLKNIAIEARKERDWESDIANKREHNFTLAKMALSELREQQRQERERQVEIAKQRLKNLKKARRVLAKQRSKDAQ